MNHIKLVLTLYLFMFSTIQAMNPAKMTPDEIKAFAESEARRYAAINEAFEVSYKQLQSRFEKKSENIPASKQQMTFDGKALIDYRILQQKLAEVRIFLETPIIKSEAQATSNPVLFAETKANILADKVNIDFKELQLLMLDHKLQILSFQPDNDDTRKRKENLLKQIENSRAQHEKSRLSLEQNLEIIRELKGERASSTLTPNTQSSSPSAQLSNVQKAGICGMIASAIGLGYFIFLKKPNVTFIADERIKESLEIIQG